MKSFIQSSVNDQLPGIVMMSHGTFAVALVESIKMAFGEPENLAALSLEPGDDIDAFRQAFAAAYESFPGSAVVMVDLYGGTPFNQVLQYAQEKNRPVELITGLNLPMVLSAVAARVYTTGDAASFVDIAVQEAAEGLKRVDVASFLASVNEVEDDEDDDE